MKRIFIAAAAVLISSTVFLSSCKKDNNNGPDYPIPSNLKLLASGYAIGSAARIEVYGTDSFFVGYNPLYLALYDSAGNQRLTDAQITLHPMMTMMGGMSHSCPLENPASNNATDGLFSCAVVYIMPSGSTGGWTLNVDILNNKNGLQGTVVMAITVLNPAVAKMKSLTALDDSSKLFVSVVKPVHPLVGVNDFEVTIHKKTGMMSFPAANDYTPVVNPQMLSMGHGSPLNENPVLQSNGHYKGKLNFTMSGEWRIYLDLNHNGAVADSSLYFDMNLE